ncbi:Cullin family-domain-containing protein [Mycena olivaceomarginata]|nr:Cullin family-domain-containing protein [Mycena olivaceomarginata]
MAEGLASAMIHEDELHGLMESTRLDFATVPAGSVHDGLTRGFVHSSTESGNPARRGSAAVLRGRVDRYTTGANYLHRPFTYLGREEGVYQVYTFALAQWRQHLFAPPTPTHLRHPALVAAQRDGASIDQALVKKVVDSFVSHGLDAADPNKECLDVYKERFEAPFLTATETYYSAEAEAFLNAGGAEGGSGKSWSTTRLRRGRGPAAHVRPSRAHPRGSSPSGANSKHTSRPPGSALVAAPAAFADKGAADKDKGEGKAGELDPKAYVDALLAVHEKNAATVARSFKGEAGFAAALDKACSELVNRNAATGTSAARLLELLAKRADMLLRKSNKVAGDVDLEGALNWVMFYTTKLSKRLIHGVSASDEAEASMISKLKEAAYVSLSKDLTDSFKERMAQNHHDMDIAFSSMVLGTKIWPLAPPTRDFCCRRNCCRRLRGLRGIIRTKHSGRKLTWLQERAADKLHEPEVHTNDGGGSVLLQYNGNDTLSLTGAAGGDQFSPEILGQVLALLVKAKVLINEERIRYDLNPGFESKKIRVNLNLPIKADVKAESSGVLKVVDEDRKRRDFDADTSPRIVKAGKTMKNQALIQEVISQYLAALHAQDPRHQEGDRDAAGEGTPSPDFLFLPVNFYLTSLSTSPSTPSTILYLLRLPSGACVANLLLTTTTYIPTWKDERPKWKSPICALLSRPPPPVQPTRPPPALSSIDISVSHVALLARPCPFPPPCLARVFVRRIFPPPPAFARPVSRLQAANLVFNPDNSWDTAEITSRPNAPVVVECPRPETRPLARKNLVEELLREQQDAATNKAAMIQVLEATERRIQEAMKAAAESIEHRLADLEVERKLTEEHTQRRAGDQQSLDDIHKLLKNNVLKHVRTAALNVLSPKEKELIKLLGDALEEGRELRNIQQHKRPDTAIALERTSIATHTPPDPYHILEGLLASDAVLDVATS